ncbi:hydantoinase B/oxoprolinase family protein [Nitratireductor sp. ZSWI3]|uniref:hydantoinase B/oxoprolinase family protein n=1 Tax=Nitratireductor sp. ZSWI3 TaxID=2966359 RepID=UPI00214FB3B4|nr:hydantoinase B/oxoprolinase family protein [Nitratireductor sp. ZSWI3]MCR4265819.1 hydantoinase B/oxoprolinase family protein [Nitratireductor sp. ZSWI3]
MPDQTSPLVEIQTHIMWNRLISLVEEQAQTLVRAAFSPIVRESGDLSAGVFDVRGRMLAQAVTGTPGHVNSMAESVKFFIEEFPPSEMKPGDVYLTNDPWKGTGHLHDMVVVTPAFYKEKLVALFACTSHLIDIGGIGFGPDGNDVIEEGLYLPFLKLADAGELNQTLLSILRGNSRYPVEAEGDVLSLAACNDVGARRLFDMMDEFNLDTLDALGEHIISTSREAVLSEIRNLRKGTFKAEMRIDGYDKPIDLMAALTISDSGIDIDFAGTSGPSVKGINVPLTYTQAYATYGVRVLIAPEVPNNAGSLDVIRVSAPKDCILHAQRPAPVSSRHVVGQMLPDVVFGCLSQVPELHAPAEGTSCLWNLILENRATQINGAMEGYTRFSILAVQTGGAGARQTLDGLSATAFPSGVSGVSVEIIESISPLLFQRKELREGSCGAGKFRGGLGQIIEIRNREHIEFQIYAALDRIEHAPRGRMGGENGATGFIGLGSGQVMNGKGRQVVPAGDTLIIHTPGGAGYGSPAERSAAAIEADRRGGLVPTRD